MSKLEIFLQMMIQNFEIFPSLKELKETLLQAFEYIESTFTLSDSVYGSTFYMLTGLHGFHVIVGTAFLLVARARMVAQHYTINAHIGYEAAA